MDASVAHSGASFIKGTHDLKVGVQDVYATQVTNKTMLLVNMMTEVNFRLIGLS